MTLHSNYKINVCCEAHCARLTWKIHVDGWTGGRTITTEEENKPRLTKLQPRCQAEPASSSWSSWRHPTLPFPFALPFAGPSLHFLCVFDCPSVVAVGSPVSKWRGPHCRPGRFPPAWLRKESPGIFHGSQFGTSRSHPSARNLTLKWAVRSL